MTIDEVRTRLDEAAKGYFLLDHPFYKAWAGGELTREDLRFYASQYWRQVEAFPGYLGAIEERLPDGFARETIAANLADEVEGDHAGLWLDFAAALGVDRGEIAASDVRPETADCVRRFNEGARDRSVAYALGMLYAYESQTPAVAQTKVEGLRAHYSVDGAGVTYFELHGELDVQHAQELAATVRSVCGSEAEALEDAVAGACAGAEAVWRLLDGVTAARAI